MSSIQVAMLTNGYINANNRPACRNCQHGSEGFASNHDTPGWRCKLGGFRTTAMAICKKHAVMPAFAQSVKGGAT